MQSGKFQYELQEFSNPTWKHCQTNHLFHLDQACFVTHASMTQKSVRLPVLFIIRETKVADPAFKLLTMAVGYNSTVCQEQVASCKWVTILSALTLSSQESLLHFSGLGICNTTDNTQAKTLRKSIWHPHLQLQIGRAHV